MQYLLSVLLSSLIFLSFNSLAKEKPSQFVFHEAQGTQIVNGEGKPVFYRGISFGNRVWTNERIPRLHHGPEDYKRVAEMGMNLVRFYINYQTLESDSKPYHYLEDGWQWLDSNIQWAKNNGVYLILNMHVPQGGFQSHGTAWDLWRDVELQNRLVKLWLAIAQRYKDEPVVFGYDLVNEPGVPDGKEQWQKVAQRLVDEIRKIDKQHPIIVERVNSINTKWEQDKELNFVTVKGDNIIYTFHCYDPFFYTHQGAFWLDYMKGRDGGSWPEKNKGNTRKALEKSIDAYLSWGKKHNVPLYFGEWGLYKSNFEKGKGGLNYIKDMMDIIEERQITNTFHVYHEESFGLYRGDAKLDPENVNEALLELFRQRYK